MVLKVLGSGSSGNCYLLENETECLVVEAGLPFLPVKKELGYDISKIVGVIITHIHADHSKYAKEYERAGIPVYKPYENTDAISFRHGRFTVKAIPMTDLDDNWTHSNGDGSHCPCYGFMITHPEIWRMVYITDTQFIKWRFKDVRHFLIEANYNPDTIDPNDPKFLHVMRGHMSIDTACEFIKESADRNTQTITICHLSNENANADEFIERMKKVSESAVYVAKKGMTINLDTVPF